MQLIQSGPLLAQRTCMMDANGAEVLVVVVKGTWTIGKNASLSVADEQQPIHFDPVYTGDPGSSSLLYESDMVPEKPGTDCVLSGHAYAANPRVREATVRFAVGPLGKSVRVFGDRVWRKTFGVVRRGAPEPFEKIPLTYERAFGGADHSTEDCRHHDHCAANPVGVGFRARRSKRPIDGEPLPNLETPEALISRPNDRPLPAGFGPIAPSWQPRLDYAGTYDEQWRRHVCPLLPPDFDARYFNAAPGGLVASSYLRGDEQVLVENASPDGRLSFCLPGVRPDITVALKARPLALPTHLDTVILEPDQRRLQLTWRARLDIHGRLHLVDWIRVNPRI